MNLPVLRRFARALLYGAVGAAIPLLPGLAESLPAEYQPFVQAFLAAIAMALDKWYRARPKAEDNSDR